VERSRLLKQAGQHYTPAFSLFQTEFDWSSSAYIVSCNEIDQRMKYLVEILIKLKSTYEVIGNAKDKTIKQG